MVPPIIPKVASIIDVRYFNPVLSFPTINRCVSKNLLFFLLSLLIRSLRIIMINLYFLIKKSNDDYLKLSFINSKLYQIKYIMQQKKFYANKAFIFDDSKNNWSFYEFFFQFNNKTNTDI